MGQAANSCRRTCKRCPNRDRARPTRCRGRYYHRSQQFSITALTDSTATIKERYAYTAYGQLTITDASGTARTATAEGNRYTYTGREWDDVAELYHFRARMYDPLTGRFCSRDPIGYADGESLYHAYFVLGWMDPTGQYMTFPHIPGRPAPPPMVPRRPRGGSRCPSEAALWARIAAIKAMFLGTLLDAGYPASYSSMPYQHCVWNCRMTTRKGPEYAERMSRLKELADVYICLLGRSLSSPCFDGLSARLRKQFVGTCCSASQPSDFRDNATGRECGKEIPCGIRRYVESCESCCNHKGLNERTEDGPGTSRPCGPLMPPEWEDDEGARSPQDW